MSRAVAVDRDLAVVYLPLMPVRLVEYLEARGFRFVEVPEGEFASMGCNVLAIAPREVVLVEGTPRRAPARAAGLQGSRHSRAPRSAARARATHLPHPAADPSKPLTDSVRSAAA